jgi:hypothetical protein
MLWVKAKSLLALGATMATFIVLAATMEAGTVKKAKSMTSETNRNIFERFLFMRTPPCKKMVNV